MKKLFIPLIGAISMVAFSCSMDKADVQLSQKRQVREKATENLSKAKEVHKKRLEDINSGKFNLVNVDFDLIKVGMKDVKSEKDLIKLWEKAGVKNAEEYISSIKAQSETIFESLYIDPVSKDLSEDEKKDLIRKSLEANNIVGKKNIKLKYTKNMKRYFLILALIFCVTYPSTQTFAKIPCETCYKNAGIQYDYALFNYVSATNQAYNQLWEPLGEGGLAFSREE